MTDAVTILLVEDNDGDARLFESVLRRSVDRRFEVVRVGYLKSAFQTLGMRDFDCVLLDLTLPDSPLGIDTLVEFTKHAPEHPVVVLTGHDALEAAQQAMSLGAQEYVVKDEARGHVLERAIVTAMQRKRNDMVKRSLTYESLNVLSGNVSAGEDPKITMLRAHIGKVTGFLEELDAYLHKNAPVLNDAVDALESKYDLDTVLRDMRGVLRIDRKRRKTLGARAVEAASDIGSTAAPPVSRRDARSTILDVVAKYNE